MKTWIALATAGLIVSTPTFADGVPVIGAVPGVPGAFVASGGGCWGILCGPATGLALSELLLDGAAASVDLTPFSPQRFA